MGQFQNNLILNLQNVELHYYIKLHLLKANLQALIGLSGDIMENLLNKGQQIVTLSSQLLIGEQQQQLIQLMILTAILSLLESVKTL